jgi:gas vesicle protein
MPRERDEEEKEAGQARRGALLVVGLLGTVAGAVTGLLLAPWRGADTRRKLREAAATASAALKEKGQAAKDKAGEVIRRRTNEKDDDRAKDD